MKGNKIKIYNVTVKCVIFYSYETWLLERNSVKALRATN